MYEKSSFKKVVKIGDIIIMIFVVGIISLVSFTVYGNPSSPSMVYIKGDTTEHIYPLDNPQFIRIEGPLGTTHVRIRNKNVWVEHSPCKNKLCVATGKIHQTNQWIACLPNKVFIQIKGGEQNKVDAASF